MSWVMRRTGWQAVCLVALGVGMGLLSGADPAARPRSTAWWVADRGGDRLYGLDEDLFLVEAIGMRAPTRVVPAPGAGVYVVNAHAGTPGGEHRLRRVQPGGVVLWERALGAVRDLDSDGRDAVLLLEPESGPGPAARVPRELGARVLACDPHGLMQPVTSGDVTCVARRAERVLVGLACGLIQLWRAGGASPLAEVDVGGEPCDLAPAIGGGWWVLTGGGETAGRLCLLSAALELLSSERSAGDGRCLVPDGRGRVWLAGRRAEVRAYAPGEGARRLQLPLAGIGRGSGLADGGALLVAPGALLRLDGDGGALPGQGGFDYLVDVSPGGP